CHKNVGYAGRHTCASDLHIQRFYDNGGHLGTWYGLNRTTQICQDAGIPLRCFENQCHPGRGILPHWKIDSRFLLPLEWAQHTRTDYPDDRSADAVVIDKPCSKRTAVEIKARGFLIDHGHSIPTGQWMVRKILA